MEVVLHELLKIELLGLPASGWQWHGEISRQLLEDVDQGHIDALHGLCRDVRWDVDLQRRGGCYYLQGSWQARVCRHCRRCNTVFKQDMQGESRRNYRLAAGEDTGEDEALAPPGRINLLDVLREDIWLTWRQTVVCMPDCKGLCQHCGKDMNRGPCACVAGDDDHPFAVLRTLKLDS